MPPKKGAKRKAASKKDKKKVNSNDTSLITQEECASIVETSSTCTERKEGEEKICYYARIYWSAELNGNGKFDNNIVKEIFDEVLCDAVDTARLSMLETSSYLEGYLWNNFTSTSSDEHLYSIVIMINEKYRVGTSIGCLTVSYDKFDCFFRKTVALSPPHESCLSIYQQAELIKFFTHIFQSLENEVLRKCALRYLSLPIWQSLTSERLDLELELNPHIRRHWQHLQEPVAAMSKRTGPKSSVDDARVVKRRKLEAPDSATLDSTLSIWIPGLLHFFLSCAEQDFTTEADVTNVVYFVEVFCEFLIDLLSQLSTRRFLNTLVDDFHVVVRCKRSMLYTFPGKGDLFRKLVERIDYFSHFEINDHTGAALTAQGVMSIYNSRLHIVQQVAHTYYPDTLKDVYFSSVGELGKSEKLRNCFSLLSHEDLKDFAHRLGYISTADASPEFIMEVLLDKLVCRHDQSEELNRMSLIPTEELLWNESLIPPGKQYDGRQVLSLPKLNLQFLTMHDYLHRNFLLFRLESAYEIRQDLQDAIKHMLPRQSFNGNVSFGGWARMALPIHSFRIEEILKPSLGEIVPARVSCSVEIDLSNFQGIFREEWEALREHDVVFLICISNPKIEAGNSDGQYDRIATERVPRNKREFTWVEEDVDFPKTFGVKYVRGGEIFEVRDEDNVILNDFTKPDDRKSGRIGTKRRFRLNLDSAQYYSDMTAGVSCYETLNLLVRRKPKENNFRAILETIRELMNTAAVGRAVPDWLHDVFLGYGNPSAVHYRNMSCDGTVNNSTDEGHVDEDADYTDTFLSATHLAESFSEADVHFQLTPEGNSIPWSDDMAISEIRTHLVPPFRLRIRRSDSTSNPLVKDKITAIPQKRPGIELFPLRKNPTNSIRFTPVQVEAIRSGMNNGLTMIVGPPGTGKTDVAVQIICNLYHNYPTQKILIVAHSNAALNDLFEKIMLRDIDPRHLLRLGSGEKGLSLGSRGFDAKGNEDVFSKHGRVNWSLSRRLALLGQVQHLAQSLKISGDVGYTCETAEYFHSEHIQSRIEKFYDNLPDAVSVREIFPFMTYFENSMQLFLKGKNFDEDKEVAISCVRHIQSIFEELSDYRAFELLRTQGHRADYLLTKQARIVAMTCTHAAMTRKRLVEVGFKYDNLVMEEAAQVLEVETLIPMLLQDTDAVDGSRLKRVILLGDHHQLPPVVQHPAFQKFSHLDQSLFSRFIRLNVPHVQLDMQGRARPEIASLYSWRYNGLGNLPLVSTKSEYTSANAGFAHTFQLINISSFQGKGEFCPTPHFYQNLGEAEYVVAVYQFMRLIGYPSEKISILTTYNGQKHLIRDIINQRCKNPLFGRPSKVTTVDKFQGQQNDIILLSLVRTDSVGHLRDVRRLIVALSRARLGLYIFCKKDLFNSCQELSPAFNLLSNKPSVLQLVDGERYPCKRAENGESGTVISVNDVTAMGVIVYQLTQQALKGGDQNLSTQLSTPKLDNASGESLEATSVVKMDVE